MLAVRGEHGGVVRLEPLTEGGVVIRAPAQQRPNVPVDDRGDVVARDVLCVSTACATASTSSRFSSRIERTSSRITRGNGTDQVRSGRPSNGIESAIVVLVATPAFSRRRRISSSNSAVVRVRTLRT